MVSSCYGPSNFSENSSLMSQSLDPNMLSQSISNKIEINGGFVERCLDGMYKI